MNRTNQKQNLHKQVVTAPFLDFSKAFDSINYETLDIKLDSLGFDENSKNLITSFLTNRCQSVILQDFISDEIMLHRVVPQGAVLGPLLFNLYINDMATTVDKETELIQYADDTHVLTFGTSIDKIWAKLKQNANNLIQFFGKSKRKDFNKQIIINSIPINQNLV